MYAKDAAIALGKRVGINQKNFTGINFQVNKSSNSPNGELFKCCTYMLVRYPDHNLDKDL